MIGVPEILIVAFPVFVLGGLYGLYAIVRAAVRHGVEEANRDAGK